MSGSREKLKRLLEQRRREQEELEEKAKREDPLTYFNEHPIEDYYDERLDKTFRLGPGPNQLAAIMDVSTWRLVQGGNRTGKSVVMLAECAMYARNLHPVRKWSIPPKILVLITTKRQAKQVWQNRLFERSCILGPADSKPLIPAHEIGLKESGKPNIEYTYSGSEKIMSLVTLKNGVEIHFYWAGAAQSWQRIEGIEFDAIFRDESNSDGTEASEQLMPELQLRLLDAQNHPIKQREHAGFMLWGCTDTKGSSELADYRARAMSDDPDWSYHQLTFEDNPLIDEDARKKAAKNLSDEDAQVRIYGTGGYDDRKYILKPHFDEDRHVLPASYFPRPTDNIVFFIDPAFGKTGSKHGILMAALSEDEPDLYRILAENSEKNRSVSEQVEIICKMLETVERKRIEAIVMDPAAAKTESTGESVWYQYVKALRARGVEVERKVMLGRNRKADVYPMLITRMQRYKLLINPECRILVRQICECKMKDRTRYSDYKGVVDKKLDLLMALVYGVSRKLRWVNRGPQTPGRPHSPNVWTPDMGFDLDEKTPDNVRAHVEQLRESARIAARFSSPRHTSMLKTVRVC